MTVKVGRGRSTRLTKYWQQDGAIFNNHGDVAELWTFDLIRIDCRSYGRASC